MDIFKITEQAARRKASAADYLELFRERSMSAGIYMLPKDAFDPQQPHSEDEVYYILAGKGKFTSAGEVVDVVAGEMIYVAKGVEHRFHDIAEDMTLLVIFAPPEGSRGPEKRP